MLTGQQWLALLRWGADEGLRMLADDALLRGVGGSRLQRNVLRRQSALLLARGVPSSSSSSGALLLR